MIESSQNVSANCKLTYGMVGGGTGSFIGDVHRKAINIDALAVLVAGCFSRNYTNTLETGNFLGIAEDRLYKSFEEMAEKESKRSDGIDFAVIVTPNYQHYAACKAFLSNGINIACEKPLCFEVTEAEELAALAKKKNLLFCVTYAYTGYPAVKEIRDMIAKGEIGTIRFVNAEYPQEWLADSSEDDDNKQAAWRKNPAMAGKSNCAGDLGSHIENMIAYTTGLSIDSVSARLDRIVEGRALDDNATIMLEFKGGAKGLYWSSQIAAGYDNAFKIRIFGSTGAIEWAQEIPNYFTLAKLGQPVQHWSRGRDGFCTHAQSYSRIPSGHPEGYFAAFANIYKTYITALSKIKAGDKPTADEMDFPTVEYGIEGVRFINKCVESSNNNSAWTKF